MSTVARFSTIPLLLLLLLPQQAATQDSTLHLLPSYSPAAVAFVLQLDKYAVVIGETFAYRFHSSQDGYVTLWDIGSSGRVTRLYPNLYQPDMRIRAGQVYDASGAASPATLQATAPAGMQDLYAVWTRTPPGQPTAAGYDSITAFRQALQDLEQVPDTHRATATVTLNIGSPASPQVVVSTGLLHTGLRTAYVLAMGANVGELTRANTDARYFAATMTRFLRVPSAHVQVVENVRVQDFADGMAWLRTQAGPQDLVIVYFFGHGSQITDDNRDEHDGLDEVFIMYDAQERPMLLGGHLVPLAEQMVRDDQFAAWLQVLRSRQALLFLDTCFSGGLHRSIGTTVTAARNKFLPSGALGHPAPLLPRGPLVAAPSGGLDALPDRRGGGPALLALAAAQEGQKALELYHGSLFTLTFLSALQQSKGQNLPRLFATVRQRVDQQSRQQQTPTLLGDAALAATFTVQ